MLGWSSRDRDQNNDFSEHLDNFDSVVVFVDTRLDETRWPWPWMLTQKGQKLNISAYYSTFLDFSLTERPTYMFICQNQKMHKLLSSKFDQLKHCEVSNRNSRVRCHISNVTEMIKCCKHEAKCQNAFWAPLHFEPKS